MFKNRHSIRLKGFDYASQGAYFLTICTYEKQQILGEIINGQMHENEYGKIVREEWYKTAHVRSNIVLDTFVVMPNHIHGIIFIGATHRVARTGNNIISPDNDRIIRIIQSGSLGAIIGQFKSIVTKRIHGLRRGDPVGHPYIWQRNFYDHIIRNDTDLYRIREYIVNNPCTWLQDENNLRA